MTEHAGKTILVVDDIVENIDVLKDTLSGQYRVLAAVNGQTALKIVSKNLPDLILLDVMMPGMDGFAVCRELKKNPDTAHIPVIFITAKTDEADEAKGFETGAVDYIRKPFSPAIILRRVHTHLSLVQSNQLRELARSSIRMLGEAGHYNDTDTGFHIWRMAEYAKLLALAAGASAQRAEIIEWAAPMHDTGKIGIPDSILKAPRKLSPTEWEEMKKHASIGAEILCYSDHPVFREAADIAMHHHEKWDGSGYPMGLSGENIPWSARVVAIADVFDALTVKRPYKDAWSIEDAMQELKNGAGSHFDPALVEVFCQIKDQILATKDKWDNK